MSALLAARLTVGWRTIPESCICELRPFYGSGRGTWGRVREDARCPVHRRDAAS
jgi:hypothetical protein